MQRSRSKKELLLLDPEIERTIRKIRRAIKTSQLEGTSEEHRIEEALESPILHSSMAEELNRGDMFGQQNPMAQHGMQQQIGQPARSLRDYVMPHVPTGSVQLPPV